MRAWPIVSARTRTSSVLSSLSWLQEAVNDLVLQTVSNQLIPSFEPDDRACVGTIGLVEAVRGGGGARPARYISIGSVMRAQIM